MGDGHVGSSLARGWERAGYEVKAVGKDEKAQKGEATVVVDLSGAPSSKSGASAEMANAPLILYRRDDDAVIGTTEHKLSFHGLEPGKHTVTVVLATADYMPFGAKEKLELTVPDSGAAMMH